MVHANLERELPAGDVIFLTPGLNHLSENHVVSCINYETLDCNDKIQDNGSTMARLINRQMQIPGGLKFYQPETKFVARSGSFHSIVDQVIAMRKANPAMVSAKGWATDFDNVSHEVDAFNAAICERMGWTTYITNPMSGAPQSPKFQALSPMDSQQLAAVAGRVKKIWAGVKTINSWEEAGYPTVDQEKAEGRAKTCSDCPLNGQGDFTKWFTAPAAAAIKKQVERFNHKKLSTPNDENLGVCQGCLCPLKTKVFCPIEFIRAHTGEEAMNELRNGKNCWIVSELSEAVV